MFRKYPSRFLLFSSLLGGATFFSSPRRCFAEAPRFTYANEIKDAEKDSQAEVDVLRLLHAFGSWSEEQDNLRYAVPLLMQYWRGRFVEFRQLLIWQWPDLESLSALPPAPALPTDLPPPRPPPEELLASDSLVEDYPYRLENGTMGVVRGAVRLGVAARTQAVALLREMCRLDNGLELCMQAPVHSKTLNQVTTQLNHRQLSLLQRLMREAWLFLAAHGVFSGAIEGSTANFMRKLRLIRGIAALPEVRTVCEIGFNAGHSSLAWLSASADISVWAFDWARNPSVGLPYTPIAADFVGRAFPGRFNLVAGSSEHTLPSFRSKLEAIAREGLGGSGVCNVLFVDGGHLEEQAAADLRNAVRLVNRTHHVLVIDDTEGRWGVAAAWDKASTTTGCKRISTPGSSSSSSASSASASAAAAWSSQPPPWKELWRVVDEPRSCFVEVHIENAGSSNVQDGSADWESCEPNTWPDQKSEMAIGVLCGTEEGENRLESAVEELQVELGWASEVPVAV